MAVAAATLAALELIGRGAEDSQGSSAPGSVVVFVRGQDEIARLTVDELRELPQVHVTVAGRDQDGPLLTTVLRAIGVEDVSRVTIVGLGAYDDGRLELSAGQLSEAVVDFSDRGTVKVCGAGIAWADWVRDVTEITIH